MKQFPSSNLETNVKFGLENYNTGIFICLRCREFLEEAHCFRIEGINWKVEPSEDEFILRNTIEENSSQIYIKTDDKNENVKNNEVDVRINKVEANSNEGNLLLELYHTEIQNTKGDAHNKMTKTNKLRKESHRSNTNTSRGIVKRLCTPYQHSTQKPYVKKLLYCDHCTYCNRNKQLLSIHVQKHFNGIEKPYKCSECSYTAVSMHLVRRHARKHSNEKPYSCDQCDYRCRRKDHLRLHKWNHSNVNDKPCKCTMCSFQTTTMNHLKVHIAYKHSDEKPFECDLCGQCYKRKDYLVMHMKKHMGKSNGKEGPKPHKCTECPYATHIASHLKRHMFIHFPLETPLSCDHCNYRSNVKDKMSKHMRNHMSDGENPFKCKECSYISTDRSHLKRHVTAKHSVGTMLSCNQCNYRSKNKFKLASHISKHSKDSEKPYKCSECSYTTTAEGYLKRHLYKHTTEQFSCDQCNFRCRSITRFTLHTMKHSKDKHHKCNECSRKYATAESLKIHVASNHSVILSCDQCNYRTTNRSSMKGHKNIHTKDGVKPYKCSECSFTTATIKYLKRHMRRNHT